MVNDALGAGAELAASQHGAFSNSQAAALGITRSMIQIRRGAGPCYRATPG